MTDLVPDDTGVDVESSDGRALGRSTSFAATEDISLVRKLAGIAFPGSDPATSNLIAVTELAERPPD